MHDCGISMQLGSPLPPPFSTIVPQVMERWKDAIAPREHVQITGNVLLRIVPVASVDGFMLGLFIEPYSAQRTGSWARSAYSLSTREGQVLDLLLSGRSTTEIAEGLSIAHSTTSDHIKRILHKTRSSSRLELFSKILS